MPSPRTLLALALVAAAVDARAQTDAEPPLAYTQVMLAPVTLADVPFSTADVPVVEALSTPAPTLDAVDASLVADVVDEPAPVEDPVQLRMPRAPVRMELAQSRRRVVLLPGVSRAPEVTTERLAVPAAVGHVTYSRAVVVVSEGGAREVRYVDAGAPALDLGAPTGCGVDALETGLRLRGLRATPLRLGMRGDAVWAAQQLLCVVGQDVTVNGVYDAEMDRAVRNFQRAHSVNGRPLAVDGAFGKNTRRALDAAVAERLGR